MIGQLIVVIYQKGLDLLELEDGRLICGTVNPSSLHHLAALLALKFVPSFVPTSTLPISEGYGGVTAGACGTQIPIFSAEKEPKLVSRSQSRNGDIPSSPCKSISTP